MKDSKVAFNTTSSTHHISSSPPWRTLRGCCPSGGRRGSTKRTGFGCCSCRCLPCSPPPARHAPIGSQTRRGRKPSCAAVAAAAWCCCLNCWPCLKKEPRGTRLRCRRLSWCLLLEAERTDFFLSDMERVKLATKRGRYLNNKAHHTTEKRAEELKAHSYRLYSNLMPHLSLYLCTIFSL